MIKMDFIFYILKFNWHDFINNLSMNISEKNFPLSHRLNGVAPFRRPTSTYPEDAEDVHRRDTMVPCKPQKEESESQPTWIFHDFSIFFQNMNRMKLHGWSKKQQRKHSQKSHHDILYQCINTNT